VLTTWARKDHCFFSMLVVHHQRQVVKLIFWLTPQRNTERPTSGLLRFIDLELVVIALAALLQRHELVVVLAIDRSALVR